jgi:O-antigen/teichoic acid export membrane protein
MLGTLLPSLIVLLNKYLNFSYTNLSSLQLGSITATLLSYLLIRPSGNQNKIINQYSLTNSLKTSYTILPHMFAMMALMNIDKVIFAQVLGQNFSGYIQVIMLIATAPIMIISALNHAWLNQILLDLKNNSSSGFKSLNLTIKRLFIFLFALIISLFILHFWLIKLLNPNIQINSDVKNTLVLGFLASFIYVIYLGNTHLLTWLNKFWILGLTTPLSVLIQTSIIYLTIDSLGYTSAAIGLGAALSFQIIFLQIYRNKTEAKNAFKLNYQLLPVAIFWFAAFYFVF